MPPSLALVTDAPHPNSRLVEEAKSRHIALRVLSYEELELASHSSPPHSNLPASNPSNPLKGVSVVLARFIEGGSLEQITFRLSLLKGLEQNRIRVINSPTAIEKTVDKAMTSLLLARHKIATPPAWSYASRQLAIQRVKTELSLGHKLVLKPLFGAGGNGITLVESPQLPEAVGGVWHLQRFIDTGGKDWRVLVVGKRAIASMVRVGKNWITNANQGAKCIATEPPQAVVNLAQRATQVLGCDYAGVDIVATPKGGYQVLEVNGIAGFFALEKASGANVAGAIIENAISGAK